MNKESANTMLKFLEEPNGNVIGFFITSHLDNVMLTIQSRCQHLNVMFDNNIYEQFNLEEEKYNQYKEVIDNYLEEIEVNKKKLTLYNKQYFEQ